MRLLKLLFSEHFYIVAYREKKKILGLFFDDDSEFTIIPETKKYWHADPIVSNNENVIFTEMYDRYKQKGCIGEITLKNNSVFSVKKIIEEDFHMSFPLTFKQNNSFYMLPETSEANKLIFYKLVNNNWERYKEINGVKYVDSVLIEEGENNIFLVNIENPEDIQKNRNKLEIISIKKSEFESHCNSYELEYENITPNNLINDNWRYEIRNGGPINIVNKKQFRIVQHSSKEKYGNSICLFEIDQLTGGQYKEHKIKEVFASDIKIKDNKKYKLERIHTYSSNEDYEAVDLYVERTGISVFLNKLYRTIIYKLYYSNR